MNKIRLYFFSLIGYFFLRNLFMPICYDDFAYAFIWDGEHGGNLGEMMNFSEEYQHRNRIESVGDIFQSQYSHYFNWGGRVFAHFLAQFFIWIGKPYFDIANTIIFTVFIILILKLTDTSFKKSEFTIGWIFFTLFFIGGHFASSVIWMTWLTGAFTYFWMTIFQFIFLLPYVNVVRSQKIDTSRLKIFLMAVMGIFAGWSNESGSLATIFLTAILIFISSRKKCLQSWMIAGFSTLILGCLLCILAPGNFAQTEFIQSVNPDFNFSLQLLKNNFLNGFIPTVSVCIAALLPTIIYFFKRGINKLNPSEILSLAFAAAGFIVPLSMIFSPKFDIRIATISLPFMIVSAVFAYNELRKSFWRISLPHYLSLGFFIVSFIYLCPIVYAYNSFNENCQNHLKIIVESDKSEIVYLPPLLSLTSEKIFLEKIYGMDYPVSQIKYFGGITPDKNNCVNIMASQYYGVKGIVGVE